MVSRSLYSQHVTTNIDGLAIFVSTYMDLIEVGVVCDIGRKASPVSDLVIAQAELMHNEGDCRLLNGAPGKSRGELYALTIGLATNRSDDIRIGNDHTHLVENLGVKVTRNGSLTRIAVR